MFCLNEEYHTTSGKRILLEIAQLNTDNILITITNLSYPKDKLSCFKFLFVFFVSYVCYKIFFLTKIFIDVSLIGATFLVVYRLFQLIQFESLTFINELGVQTGTKYFMGMKSSMFIPTSDIHDVVIHEVICDLKVIYLLMLRTKGMLYDTKPIIPLFDGLRPSVNCLELIYKVLFKKFYHD